MAVVVQKGGLGSTEVLTAGARSTDGYITGRTRSPMVHVDYYL